MVKHMASRKKWEEVTFGELSEGDVIRYKFPRGDTKIGRAFGFARNAEHTSFLVRWETGGPVAQGCQVNGWPIERKVRVEPN